MPENKNYHKEAIDRQAEYLQRKQFNITQDAANLVATITKRLPEGARIPDHSDVALVCRKENLSDEEKIVMRQIYNSIEFSANQLARVLVEYEKLDAALHTLALVRNDVAFSERADRRKEENNA